MKALPWPVGRYRRILPALTTNQNAGFVTVPSEKNDNMYFICMREGGEGGEGGDFLCGIILHFNRA